jgi:acyl dehydratase
MKTSPALLLEQGAMLKALAKIAIKSALPIGKKIKVNPASFPAIIKTLASPSASLVKSYARWAGADERKYADVLPPHMFTQFALPICIRQIEMTRYRIGSIINQGCGMTIHGNIKLGQEIKVCCEVVSITEENGRARLHQRLTIGSTDNDKAVDVDSYSAFIIGRGDKKQRSVEDSLEFESLGSWDTTANDGLEFGILTGDLNPIHWITPLAKMSPFKSKVLHGYGMFVRSFELIEKASNAQVKAIDVRFISPVFLPSKGNEVFRSVSKDDNGEHRLELRDATGKVKMIGSFR